jgi:hypothetical protein
MPFRNDVKNIGDILMSELWEKIPVIMFVFLLLILIILVNIDLISIGDYVIAFIINIWGLVIWSIIYRK